MADEESVTEDPAARKRTLRRELSERVPDPGTEAARRAATRVAERTLLLREVTGARAILSCLSFGRELDTRELVKRLLDAGQEVYLPRIGRQDDRLHLHRYPCKLETLSFGLEQPVASAPELPAEAIDGTIGAVLVLGVGFDRRGFRLGSGRGYFDRFLATHPLPAIGLAYDSQLLDRLPVEPHDLPMAVVVTEIGTIRPLPARR